MMLVVLFALTAGDPVSGPADGSPIHIEFPRDGFASFTSQVHPGNRIGYRFPEHVPLVHGEVPHDLRQAGIDSETTTRLIDDYAGRHGIATYRRQVSGKGWVPQDWTFYLAAVDDGIELLLVVQTHDKGLNEFYGIQQCFRLGGVTNADWRRKIAQTPAFSEYDLWAKRRDLTAAESLTYVLRKGTWQSLPACRESVGCRTPLGLRIDEKRAGGDLAAMTSIGPYQARAFQPVDCGLITRTNLEGTWCCGVYWQRTSHLTDHHPADCLHSIVNIGNVPPHARRAVRGKIYWCKGTKADLLERWRRDFSPSR